MRIRIYTKSMGTIYLIRNTVNEKVYIGQTSRPLQMRLDEHLGDLVVGIHYNKHLQSAFKTYGNDCFEFDVLEANVLVEDLTRREKYWIEYYDSLNPEKGYNLREPDYAFTDEVRELLRRNWIGA